MKKKTLPEVAAPLENDEMVRKYFPDSQAVNQALRTLIALFPEKRERTGSRMRR